MVSLEEIGGQICEPAAGVSKVYYALWSDFATINDPKDICNNIPANEAGSYAELVEINTAHTFKVGKCFKEIKTITNTGNIKSSQVGETERHLFQNEFAFEVADSNANVLGFQRFIKNQKFVFLVEEFGSGRVRQLGWSRLGALVKSQEHMLEAKLDGKNSATITIEDTNFSPAPIYKGAILLVPQV